MTGFGRASFEIDGFHYRVELRSVNGRFLDVRSRIPFGDARLETLAIGRIRERLFRGRVELNVQEAGGGGGIALRLNTVLAQQLANILRDLSAALGTDVGTAAGLLPPHKDLITGLPALNADAVCQVFLTALDEALANLVEMREREGKGLADDLCHHLDIVEDQRTQIAALTADEPERIRVRLAERLAHLGASELDPQRIAQEIALLAERCDVSEELSRIAIHRKQLGAMLEGEGPTGRKLEFMLQELNREANTIASKTTCAEVGSLVVDLKGVLERMREQAQNVE